MQLFDGQTSQTFHDPNVRIETRYNNSTVYTLGEEEPYIPLKDVITAMKVVFEQNNPGKEAPRARELFAMNLNHLRMPGKNVVPVAADVRAFTTETSNRSEYNFLPHDVKTASLFANINELTGGHYKFEKGALFQFKGTGYGFANIGRHPDIVEYLRNVAAGETHLPGLSELTTGDYVVAEKLTGEHVIEVLRQGLIHNYLPARFPLFAIPIESLRSRRGPRVIPEEIAFGETLYVQGYVNPGGFDFADIGDFVEKGATVDQVFQHFQDVAFHFTEREFDITSKGGRQELMTFFMDKVFYDLHVEYDNGVGWGTNPIAQNWTIAGRKDRSDTNIGEGKSSVYSTTSLNPHLVLEFKCYLDAMANCGDEVFGYAVEHSEKILQNIIDQAYENNDPENIKAILDSVFTGGIISATSAKFKFTPAFLEANIRRSEYRVVLNQVGFYYTLAESLYKLEPTVVYKLAENLANVLFTEQEVDANLLNLISEIAYWGGDEGANLIDVLLAELPAPNIKRVLLQEFSVNRDVTPTLAVELIGNAVASAIDLELGPESVARIISCLCSFTYNPIEGENKRAVSQRRKQLAEQRAQLVSDIERMLDNRALYKTPEVLRALDFQKGLTLDIIDYSDDED